jgi:hypothetical protein
MLPHTPGAVGELQKQIIASIETSKAAGGAEDGKV